MWNVKLQEYSLNATCEDTILFVNFSVNTVNCIDIYELRILAKLFDNN